MATAVQNIFPRSKPVWRSNGERPSGTVRVGLLGLGHVGRALVRAAEQFRDTIAQRGSELRIVAALVRDRTRPREFRPSGLLLTDDPAAFLAQPLDVAVEVLGGVEPAGTLVRRLLQSGVPVVTANKSLLADQGPALQRLAAERGTELRIEASVLAGVPFLGTHARRPLAARIERITGILNGTSNYVLTAIAREGLTCESALARARAAGYAEPDPSSDLDGTDAAEKLVVLLGALGVAQPRTAEIERTGSDGVTPADLAAARALGGCIKPVVYAVLASSHIEAFVGPAFVPAEHPLARIDGVENAVQLRHPALGERLYAGPGAGPAVTAATILDDILEIAAPPSPLFCHSRTVCATPPTTCVAPATPWFVRVDFAAAPPEHTAILAFLGAHGVWAQQTTVRSSADGRTSWFALTCVCSRARIAAALAALRDATNCTCTYIRVLEK